MKENQADTHESQEELLTQDVPQAETFKAGRNNFYSGMIEDSSIQAAMQPWLQMECYQLGRGNRVAQMDYLDLGRQHIARETQQATVQKQGIMPSNLCTISYCSPGSKTRFSEFHSINADAVFFMPEHTEFDIYVPAGIQTTYICIEQDDFLNVARTLNPEEWEDADSLRIINTTQQTLLKEILDSSLKIAESNDVMGTFQETEQIQSMLLQNVLQVAASTKLEDLRPSIDQRKRALFICRKTCDFIEDSLALDIVPTIVDICKLIGVSERTLQYAFRSYVDMPPNVYLRLRRLNRVRAILRASDPQSTTVTTVAMRFGFLHLSRFAQEYRQLFNESPSKTLAY